ncbi:MAG TPA: hypothetical protein VK750_10535 [Cytophagaceae bacterium]|jgi:carbon starvation protein CstA|nr:hypothetical protein [Cytophagaceae bacterium]
MISLGIRYFFLLLLGIITFCLGLIRYDYVINVIDPSLPFLLSRNTAELATYPLDFKTFTSSLFHDPRWLSALIYMIYPAIATSIAVYLIFQKRKYVQLTLLFYSFGILMLGLFIFCSLLFHQYTNGYAVAQYFKKIYQEPYASLLLLGSFYWDQKNKRQQ